MRIAIVGSGGHARVVASVIGAAGADVWGFVDDCVETHGHLVGLSLVRGGIEQLRSSRDEFDAAIVAVGNNADRTRLAQQLEEWGIPLAQVIHPSAVIAPATQIGAGTVIMAGAIVQTGSVVGSNVIVNTAATIDHDCVVEDYVHLAPGVHLAGSVHVGRGSLLGVGTVVVPGIVIGEGAVVGAGSVALRDIPPNVLAYGVPAKAQRPIESDDASHSEAPSAPLKLRGDDTSQRQSACRFRATIQRDGGRAAVTDDFFRSECYYRAEGVSHTLRIEDREGQTVLVAPVIVQEIPGTSLVDGVSPYGYPGTVVCGRESVNLDEVDWRETGLVCVFIRDSIQPDSRLNSGRDRGPVFLVDCANPVRIRKSSRYEIRRNQQMGYCVERIPMAEASESDREAFRGVYLETMIRDRAARRYFFTPEYFSMVMAFERSWLFLVKTPNGDVAAASIVVYSDRMLHYYLAGTGDRYLVDAPSKNAVAAMISLAEEVGLPLNLGGGLRAGDNLEMFKRGFANRSETFRTHEIVCDKLEYEVLSNGKGCSGFFPAYRS